MIYIYYCIEIEFENIEKNGFNVQIVYKILSTQFAKKKTHSQKCTVVFVDLIRPKVNIFWLVRVYK